LAAAIAAGDVFGAEVFGHERQAHGRALFTLGLLEEFTGSVPYAVRFSPRPLRSSTVNTERAH
jgi:hypothetical protein